MHVLGIATPTEDVRICVCQFPVGRGYKCACPTHYVLASDEVSCVAPKNFLVFSQKSSFGRLVSSNATADAPSAPLPIVGKNIKVIEYDPVGQNFFWVSHEFNSSQVPQLLIIIPLNTSL